MAPSNPFRSTWFTFLLGSLFGFFAGSTVFSGLSLQVFSEDYTQSIEVTTHALRALASLRHFPESNGWGLVHVFYGNNSHLPLTNAISTSTQVSNWFGQFRQDYFVSRVLNGKKGGFFVDLGAGHATEASQSYALETHYGWSGLCIEHDSQYWESLSFRKCDVVGAAVVQGSPRTRPKRKASNEPRLQHTVPLREIFERFEVPRIIDYLCIREITDSHVVFEHFPFDRYRFRVLTVREPSAEFQQILRRHGYILLFEIRDSDMLWIHQSIQPTIQNLRGITEETQALSLTTREQ